MAVVTASVPDFLPSAWLLNKTVPCVFIVPALQWKTPHWTPPLTSHRQTQRKTVGVHTAILAPDCLYMIQTASYVQCGA